MSAKKKMALVMKKGVDWKSCTSISNNLIESYKSTGHEIEFFDIPMYGEFPADFISSSKKISAFGPDVISFVDHGEAPYVLISHYLLNNEETDTEFIFHIYGDFTYFLDSWARTLGLLKGKRVKLVCASEAQKEVVENVLECEPGFVKKIPFSVDTTTFHFDESLRTGFRKKYNVSEDEKVLVYTGRISLQKNVVYLVECFRDFCKKFGGEKTRLFIAGPCDDIGMPYLNKNLLINFYRSKFLETIEESSNIHYLGNLDSNELNELYCGSDVYCSLSVHNDEDFGMAPAEALMTGCLGVLSNWGGYKDYIMNCEQVSPVPVEILNDTVEINSAPFYKTLMKQLAIGLSTEERNQNIEKVGEHFSLSKSKENIKDLIETPIERLPEIKGKIDRFAEKSKEGRLFNKAAFSDEYVDIYKGKYD